MVRRIGGKGMAAVTATVLAAAALSQNADVPMLWQPETTLSSVHQAYVRRSAYLIASAKGDTLLLPEINLYKMADPGLGYVQAPYPARPIGADLAVDVSYTAVLEPYRPEERAFLDSLQRWNGATHEIVLDTCVIREPFRADVFRLIPRSG
jgi:hypothetical protein